MMKADLPYYPIECGLHSEYELAIMHKVKVILSWGEPDQPIQMKTVEPIDLVVRGKQEFLKARTSNNNMIEIRLDKIVEFKPIS